MRKSKTEFLKSSLFPFISCVLLISTFVLGIHVISFKREIKDLEEIINIQDGVIDAMDDTFFLYSKYSLKVLELQQIRTDEVITRYVPREYEYAVRKNYGEYRYSHILETDRCRGILKELKKGLEEWKSQN